MRVQGVYWDDLAGPQIWKEKFTEFLRVGTAVLRPQNWLGLRKTVSCQHYWKRCCLKTYGPWDVTRAVIWVSISRWNSFSPAKVFVALGRFLLLLNEGTTVSQAGIHLVSTRSSPEALWVKGECFKKSEKSEKSPFTKIRSCHVWWTTHCLHDTRRHITEKKVVSSNNEKLTGCFIVVLSTEWTGLWNSPPTPSRPVWCGILQCSAGPTHSRRRHVGRKQALLLPRLHQWILRRVAEP